MKAENVEAGKKYWIRHGWSVIRAKCISKHEGRMIFRFWWPFPLSLDVDEIFERDIIGPTTPNKENK